MRNMVLRVFQIFTVAYITIMLFVGAVARISWNYNSVMMCEWPREIEQEAWSMERDEVLLVKDASMYVDGEYVWQVKMSHWTDKELTAWLTSEDDLGKSGGGWLYGKSRDEYMLVVYSDMRVEYLRFLENDCYLGRGAPSELEKIAGRLDYAGRSIPYHWFGEAGLWLIDIVPRVILMATIFWTIFRYCSKIVASSETFERVDVGAGRSKK